MQKYAGVIENAWPPFPACECVELYGAITNEILNLVDKYFEMQKHDVVQALEIYQKAGEKHSLDKQEKHIGCTILQQDTTTYILEGKSLFKILF